jgi:hypothetical protein
VRSRPTPRATLLWGWAAGVIVVLALGAARPLPFDGWDEAAWPWAVGPMVLPVAAALVLQRRPGNPIGRLLGVAGTAAGLMFATSWAIVTWPEVAVVGWAARAAGMGVVVEIGALLALVHVYPTGRPFGRAHRMVLGVLALTLTAAAVSSVRVILPGGAVDPTAPAWVVTVHELTLLAAALLGLGGIAVLLARYRLAGPVVRAQLKWFVSGAVTFVAMFVASGLVSAEASRLAHLATGWFIVLGFWSLTGAIVIAITRYRLFDIDRVLSRTIGYALLSLILLGVYAVGVVGFGSAARAITGRSVNDLGTALSTLAVAAAFQPLRRGLQRQVDRRFDRARYDAIVTVQAFAHRLRQETALDVVERELLRTVTGSLHPAHASLWLPPPRVGDDRA